DQISKDLDDLDKKSVEDLSEARKRIADERRLMFEAGRGDELLDKERPLSPGLTRVPAPRWRRQGTEAGNEVITTGSKGQEKPCRRFPARLEASAILVYGHRATTDSLLLGQPPRPLCAQLPCWAGRPAPLSPPPLAGATRRLRICWPRDPVIGALPLELAMKSTVSTAWLLLLTLLGSALAAAEGGSPSACAGAEACVEEASEDDPVALLQARQPAAAAGADEVGG
ncbi:unnamed protein product, partial [Polarella glacialis]